MEGSYIFLTGVIATLMGYLVGMKKTKAEAQNTEMDSVQKAVTVWRELSESLHQELEALKKEFVELKKSYGIMEQENKILSQKVNDLTNFNTE